MVRPGARTRCGTAAQGKEAEGEVAGRTAPSPHPAYSRRSLRVRNKWSGGRLLQWGIAAMPSFRDRQGKQRMNHESQSLELGSYLPAVRERLERWDAEDFARRLWAKDPTLWSVEPQPELTDRLGWLTLHETMRSKLPKLRALADEAKQEGFRHAVLLGMGGSSLAPEVYQRTFGNAPGYPELLVLDSTHPDAVRAVADRIDPAQTIFVVSSKSGGTLETMSGFRYFWSLVVDTTEMPGSHFVAVTDPGSSLDVAGNRAGLPRRLPCSVRRWRKVFGPHRLRPGTRRADRSRSGDAAGSNRRVRRVRRAIRFRPPEPRPPAWCGPGRAGSGRTGQGHLRCLTRSGGFSRLGRAAGCRIDRQGWQGDRSGCRRSTWRILRSTARIVSSCTSPSTVTRTEARQLPSRDSRTQVIRWPGSRSGTATTWPRRCSGPRWRPPPPAQCSGSILSISRTCSSPRRWRRKLWKGPETRANRLPRLARATPPL